MQLSNSETHHKIEGLVGNAQFTEEQRQQLAHNDLLFGAAFARIVSVMIRHEPHKNLRLTDLELLVVPPLFTGQFALLNDTIEGAPLPVPVGVAFWASVSPEVDQRLSSNPADFKLAPAEWRSGDILWLVDVIGNEKAVSIILQQSEATVFLWQDVKVRRKVNDGWAAVSFLKAPER
jgi:cytolysin-activating lysine-acyltransferase